MKKRRSQRDLAQALLREQGIMRLAELREAGVTAATMSRMERASEVTRLSRGVYQLPDADLDPNHSLAEASKRVPKGIVCLVSALAFHGMTDQLPPRVWMAIGSKEWAPQLEGTPIRVVRFTDRLRSEDVETHIIEGVVVKVFGAARTVADCFRHRRTVGLSIAIEGLQESLRQRKATPAEIARQAEKGRVSTVVRPYLEALTANA
jgi:predicted transcriptional regulator of viral defense system